MNKYKAKKVKTAEGTFDSKKEFNRWIELGTLQAEGKISGLQRQVKYELIPSQYIRGKCAERSCIYIADFLYMQDGDLIVEDVKSKATKKRPEYIIKRKLMLWRYGIKIKEV